MLKKIITSNFILNSLFYVFFIPGLFCFILNPLYGESYYYYNDFSSSLGSEWLSTNLSKTWYGRAGITTNQKIPTLNRTGAQSQPSEPWNCNDLSEVIVTNGVLKLRKYVNTDSAYCGYWSGHDIVLNKSYIATEYKPFGYEIIRKYAWLDPDWLDNPSDTSPRYNVDTSIWLFVDKNISAQWEQYDYILCFYDYSQHYYNQYRSGDHSQWGYYMSAAKPIDLGQALDHWGNTVDLTNGGSILDGGNGVLEWVYNDKWTNLSGVHGGSNTNWIGLRISHNGNSIKLFINPDPRNMNPYPNEYLLVKDIPVSWYSNLKLQIGHGTRRYNMEAMDVYYDDLLIREVAKKINFRIQHELNNDAYALIIKPEFWNKNDAGIAQLEIYLPNDALGRKNYTWDISSIRILTEYGDGLEDNKITDLTVIRNNLPENKQVFVKTYPLQSDKLFCLFSQQKPYNVINYDTPNKTIKIVFKLKNLQLSDFKKFKVFADAIKYDNTDYPFHSTTGKMRARYISIKGESNISMK